MSKRIPVRTYLILLGLLIFFGGFAASVVFTESRLMNGLVGNEEALPDEGLDNVQRLAMSHVTDLTKLMINWSIGVIAGIAVAARAVFSWELKGKGIINTALLVALLTSLISIWLGLLVFDQIVHILTHYQDPLLSKKFLLTRRWQYLTFLASLVVFVASWLIVALVQPPEEKKQ